MSAIKDIKKEIINKVSAISSVNKVYGFEKTNPDGFPAAFITYSGMDNEFFTTAENKRIYAYRVLVLSQIGQSLDSADQVETAENQIEDLIGDIINAIDSDYTLGTNAEILFVDASIGEPGYVQYEGGWARSGSVTVRVHSLFLV
jgi:hypothetical protein